MVCDVLPFPQIKLNEDDLNYQDVTLNINPSHVLEYFNKGKLSFLEATKLFLAGCPDEELGLWTERLILAEEKKKTLRKEKRLRAKLKEALHT